MQNVFVSNIVDNLSRIKPGTRKSFIQAIKDSLGTASFEIIDTHNTASVIFIIKSRDVQLLLKAEHGQRTATHNEIDWYEGQVAAGKDYHNLFVAGERLSAGALLFLCYIEGVSTLDEWVSLTSSNAADFGKFIVEALDYDKELFAETMRSTRAGEAEQFILDKYRSRREEARQIPYLDQLLSSMNVVINGKRYLTPDEAQRKIGSNTAIMKRLLPTKVGLIHGDLHTGNILIRGRTLYYVDPNGNLNMPIEYDIGKLLHSVHGRYPRIMQGQYQLKVNKAKEYEFTVTPNEMYDSALEYLRESLMYHEYLRGLYAEALHFATMLPHHTKNREETIALFLRATELFNELLLLL